MGASNQGWSEGNQERLPRGSSSPKGEAGFGQAKRNLEHSAENSMCKDPEAKENLVHIFREVKIDRPCCLQLLQAARKSHTDISVRTWLIGILFTFDHLPLHSFI